MHTHDVFPDHRHTSQVPDIVRALLADTRRLRRMQDALAAHQRLFVWCVVVLRTHARAAT